MDNIRKSFKELKWYEYVMGAIMVFIALRAMVLGFTEGSADGNPAWLTVINFISAVCGVLCIFFTAKANISNFLFDDSHTVTHTDLTLEYDLILCKLGVTSELR